MEMSTLISKINGVGGGEVTKKGVWTITLFLRGRG